MEANIPIITPIQAEQPKNLKLTLLPFQKESLYWMRKQEQGEWRGGMLAVRTCLTVFLANANPIITFRTRWGTLFRNA